VTTSLVPLGSRHSCVEGTFLSCGAALLARVSVTVGAGVGACKRVIFDYSGVPTVYCIVLCIIFICS
jgi:hypothetical protein